MPRRLRRVTEAGNSIVEVLGSSEAGGASITVDGRVLSFGETGGTDQVRCDRPLHWGDQERGLLTVFASFALNEAQERVLLDETAGQIAGALEARELQLQLHLSSRLVSLGQMAAGVAHELNQPLDVMSTVAGDIYLRLTEGIALSQEELKSMMQDALGMVERMAGTIEHLRTFSREPTDEPGTTLSLNDCVDASFRMIGTQLRNRGIEVEVSLEDDLPTAVGHPHQIEQVVLNLLSNARDAVEERDEEKQITLETYSRIGSVVLVVTDTGTGIAEGDLGRLFEPFFTTKEEGRGTGLGLSISYGIVKEPGGEITVDSKVGEGSTVTVTLPVKGEEEGSR